MKHSITIAITAFLFASSCAHAGVVMNMVTRDASGTESERTRVYAQSKKILMEQDGGEKAEGAMIFLGDEFLYVDHSDKSYVVMDEAALDEVSAKIKDAMKGMEAQLANMPPEQRAMMEKMMKGRMQGMMGQQADKAPPPRVESMGNGEWDSRKCREYAVFEGTIKTQQICAAELEDVDGSDEVIEAFRSMAAYISKMTESMPMISGNQPNPGELMDQIDGFPIHIIHFDNGVMVREMSLDSVVEQDLDETMFAPPEGYRRKDPFRGR